MELVPGLHGVKTKSCIQSDIWDKTHFQYTRLRFQAISTFIMTQIKNTVPELGLDHGPCKPPLKSYSGVAEVTLTTANSLMLG